MVGIEQASFEERDPAVELDAVDVESPVGNTQSEQPVGVEQTLMGDVVDGEYVRHAGTVPAQESGGQCGRPIVHMEKVRVPVDAAEALRELGRGQRKPGEAKIVIGPVRPVRPSVWTASALEQRR